MKVNGMVFGIGNDEFAGGTELVQDIVIRDIVVNNEASTYVAKNRNQLVRKAVANGIKNWSDAEDLVDDMVVKLIEQERDGKGYNSEYGDGGISVEKFVYGRLALYCKNSEYNSNYSERKKDKIVKTTVIEAPVIDRKTGKVKRDRKGNVKTEKRTVNETIELDVRVISASPTGDEEEMDGIQQAYANASSIEDFEFCDENALRSYMDTCIDICGYRNVDIVTFIKNFADISSLSVVGGSVIKCDIIDKVKSLMAEHSDLREAMREIFTFRELYRTQFDEIISEY